MTATETDPDVQRMIAAIETQVPFDGWSPAAFKAAAEQAGIAPVRARSLAPRGAVDLAAASHRLGDRRMAATLAEADLDGLKFREKVAFAIRARLSAIGDREAARRATALFALPHLAPEGTRLVWGTADAIWTALGDTSDDVNWYTKRATLSGVWASVLLYWLGDDSLGQQATEDFIDRRIEDVMRIETLKGRVNANPLLRPVTAPLGRLFGRIRAPSRMPPADLPGHWTEGGGA